ncbi:hypothetical protein [Marinomonas shanghaiensis]|uniref:hypothetical protein n=1 Tax=Marinomonas shanghaiensis TaxID=2202418 RepID=UPI000DB9412C|nr:hypothetical protein [Marinomonas shanghaiensis]
MFAEAQHLDKLWKLVTNKETGEKYYRADKSTKLIVSSVTFDEHQKNGHLNNDHWTFCVGYAFRDALGLSFDQRRKSKVPYMVWTQSPYIYFKEGDLLISKCGNYSLQVKMANAVRRVKDTNLIDYGLVDFSVLKKTEGKYRHRAMKTMTQYEFLQVLIYGLPDSLL